MMLSSDKELHRELDYNQDLTNYIIFFIVQLKGMRIESKPSNMEIQIYATEQ